MRQMFFCITFTMKHSNMLQPYRDTMRSSFKWRVTPRFWKVFVHNVSDYIGKLRPAMLMETYAPFNNFITTVCYRDLTAILCNNTRVRTTRWDRRTYYKLGFGGRLVFNVSDNLVAFIKVKRRFNFRNNLKKKVLAKIINNWSLRHRNEIRVSEAELREYIRGVKYPIIRLIIQNCSYLDFLG